jgi:hypothetical protein
MVDGARGLTAEASGGPPADHARWLALAQQQRQRGEAAAAAASFRRAAELAPPGVNVWNVVSAAHLAAAQYTQALDAADRAIALEPARAAVHANRGIALSYLRRDEEAIASLQHAVGLKPDSAELIEHLALALHRGGRQTEATPWVTRLAALFTGGATRIRPLPLVGLLLEQADVAGAARVVQAALSQPGLPPALRIELASTAAQLEVHARLEPAIQTAGPALDFAMLAASIASVTPDPAPADDALLAKLERVVRRAVKLPVEARPSDCSEPVDVTSWPAVAAHFNSNGGDEADAVRRTIQRLRAVSVGLPHAAAPEDAALADMRAEAQLVAQLAATAARPRSGREWEAWLRLLHCRLNAHRPGMLPGHLKVAPNSLRINPREPRTEPRLTAGTLRRFYADIYPVATTGWSRAVMHIYVMAKVHPFVDGNGALGRLLASDVLAADGFGPLVLPGRLREPGYEAIRQIHRADDPAPLLGVLVEAWRSRDAILRTLR